MGFFELELFKDAQALHDKLGCSEPFSANDTFEAFNVTFTEEYWDFVCGKLDKLYEPEIFQLTLYISIFLIGFSGNTVIIFHILQHGNIVRDLHSAYVLSLSCSDIIYLSLVPFQAIQMVTKTWIFGDITCRLFNTMDVFANHASVASITLMCYDRMCAVTKPHSYSHRSKYETRLILSISWVSGFILSIPNLVFSELTPGFLAKRLSCSADFIEPHYDKLYIAFLYVVDGGMPVVITTIMYSLTLHAIVKRHQKWNKNSQNNLGHKKRSINLRMVFLVLSIIATFWLCYLPFWTFNLLQAFGMAPNVGAFDLRLVF
ncbi:urotensin-2 receptor-like [Convolutriloba macropyga]|uniref:urotensin-2 receptor-like n=1 Tax=Convolutriloba macropyga TaxID=536237 RepID=UPI003F51DB9C